MRTISRLKSRPLSPARQQLVDAAAAARYTLRDLSALLGRNPSYLQQYLAKESPRRLQAEDRHALASLLGIPASALLDSDESRPAPEPRAQPATRPAAPTSTDVPLLTETSIDGQAETLTLPAALALSPQAIAIRLSHQRGILQPRTIIVTDPGALTRIGDMVALVDCDDADHKLAAVGILLPATDGGLAVQNQDTAPVRSTAKLWRVICIFCG